MVNNTTNLFVKTAITILVISNDNSFRVPFDKIDKIYLYFSPLEPALCQLYRHTFVAYWPGENAFLCLQPKTAIFKW